MRTPTDYFAGLIQQFFFIRFGFFLLRQLSSIALYFGSIHPYRQCEPLFHRLVELLDPSQLYLIAITKLL